MNCCPLKLPVSNDTFPVSLFFCVSPLKNCLASYHFLVCKRSQSADWIMLGKYLCLEKAPKLYSRSKLRIHGHFYVVCDELICVWNWCVSGKYWGLSKSRNFLVSAQCLYSFSPWMNVQASKPKLWCNRGCSNFERKSISSHFICSSS